MKRIHNLCNRSYHKTVYLVWHYRLGTMKGIYAAYLSPGKLDLFSVAHDWCNRLCELTQNFFHKTYFVIACIVSWWLWCQKGVSQAGISKYIPQFTVGCDYLSLSDWDACFWCQSPYLTKWKIFAWSEYIPFLACVLYYVYHYFFDGLLCHLLIRVNQGELLSPRTEYHLMILITIDVVFYNNQGPENGCFPTEDIRKWLSERIKQKLVCAIFQ